MRAIAALVIVMLSAAQVRAEEQTVEVIDPGAGRKRVALFIGLGGVALWGASFGVTMWARSKYSQCADNGVLLTGPAAADCPYTDEQRATDYANKHKGISRIWGTTLFLAGTAAIGTALYLRITAPAKRRVVRVSLAPSIAPDGFGLTLGGGF